MKPCLITKNISALLLSGTLVLCTAFNSVMAVKSPQTVKNFKTGLKNWLIIPGKQFGFITVHTTVSDLKKRYGARNVFPHKFDANAEAAEDEPCQSNWVAIANKEFAVCFDSAFKKTTGVDLYGPADNKPKERWITVDGIRIGTTLEKLKALNKEPFLLGPALNMDFVVTPINGKKLSHPFNHLTLYLDSISGHSTDYLGTKRPDEEGYRSDSSWLPSSYIVVSRIRITLK